MKKTLMALTAGFALVSITTSAHAFTVMPLNAQQQAAAKAQVQKLLGGVVKGVKFGFGPTPRGFIGSGLEWIKGVDVKGGVRRGFKYLVNPNGNIINNGK